MKLRYFALLLVGGMMGFAASLLHAAGPNVILVITDDQGHGDLACHGNPVIVTPTMDRLHAESVRLVDFHVGATCAPTRAALMTGRSQNRSGVWHTVMGRSLLPPDEVTVAEVLRDGGYATGHFGKWHLGDNYPTRPQDHGFNHVVRHGGGGVGQTPDYWGNDYFDDTYEHNGRYVKHTGYCTDIWFDEAIKFIDRSVKQGKPFFAYITTNAPHSPYLVADSYSDPYKKKGVSEEVAKFYGMITNIDDNLAKLEQFLKAKDLRENTILIFMTDNGSSAGARFYNAGMRGNKGSQYEGGHRVPFFIRWPAGNIGGGRDVRSITAHIDVLPTLADLCGVALDPNHPPIEGRSLKPLLVGDGKTDWPDRVIITDSQRLEHLQKWRKSSVMTDRWRLIDGQELYAINKDPAQKHNIAATHPDVVDKLRAAYEQWWTKASERADEYVRIALGSDAANPTTLTSHDWHTNNAPVPWNHQQIASGLLSNGPWAVDVVKAGTYRFTLRRWPAEAPGPIRKGLFDVTQARLKIADIEQTMPVKPDDAKVIFTVELPAGPTMLQTWFTNAGKKSTGAYYVTVERM